MRGLKVGKLITDRSESGLQAYLNDIAREPLLTVEDETHLAEIIQKGGENAEKARDKLVTSNLRFVVSVAKQYQRQGMSLTDLINEGNLGLIKAAEKFDPTRGFKFISYAVWWIRQTIIQALSEQGRIVRVPLNNIGALNKINQATEKFVQEHGRQPSPDELEELTGLEPEKIDRSLMARGQKTSLDAPIATDNEATGTDMLTSDDDRTDKAVDKRDMDEELSKILNTVLRPREVNIVKELYGLGTREHSLEELSEKTGLSRERIRQIKEKSLQKIRHSSYSKVLMKYLG